MPKICTLIGSRTTQKIPAMMEAAIRVARYLREEGYWIRSGGAEGMDRAAQLGGEDKCIVYEPWRGFSGPGKHIKRVPEFTPELEALARRFHPTYNSLSQGAQKLMMRNGCQILGEKLNKPSNFIICGASPCLGDFTMTYKSSVEGGTGQAIRIANEYNIPWLNLNNYDSEEWLDEVKKFVKEIEAKHVK